MNSSRIVPVILCGGAGTRLWPRSRKAKPKPFQRIVGDETLFQQALHRCADKEPFDSPVIVTGAAHIQHVNDQLNVPNARLIVEPEPKNTASAIGLAAVSLPPETMMLVCPSDHYIGNSRAFLDSVRRAAELASGGWLVSLAIEPRSPNTGFGYLERGSSIGTLGYKVATFVEKPDLERARSYLESGKYAWNAGIFAFKAGVFCEELRRFRPEMYDAVAQSVAMGREEGTTFRPDPASFAKIKAESVDYAVMENTDRAAMVLVDMNWSDIGNWQAVYSALPQDENGNAVRGSAELVDCRNVLVDSDGSRISAIGLSDVIIVADGSDILIISAESAHRVGTLSAVTDQ